MSREEKEFLINGTVLKCTEGDKETEFNIPEKNLKIQGFSAANEEDDVAGINILPFGKCKIKGEECRLDKELMGQKLQWQNILKVSICGKSSLLDDSFCLCPIGGIIEVVESKQIDFGAEYMKYTENIQEKLATINELFGALEYSMSIVPFEVWKVGIDPVMTNSNYENVNNTYMRLHSDPTMTAEKWNNRYRKREDMSSTMKKNPNDLIPKFSLKELFSKGTSVEGIMELHSVGVDSQNKKMIPGIFGGDVKVSALTAGYTEYTSDETYEIVSSLSEKGKAAYKLRTRANKGQDIYKAGVEVSGIVYAGYRTYKTNKSGKVRVGKAPVVVEKSQKGVNAQIKGLKREIKVASIEDGYIFGHEVVVDGIGRTDIDVISKNGDFIAVGGPAKAKNLTHFAQKIKVLKAAASNESVNVKYYLEKGTPESAINVAKKWLGEENVIIFE